MEYGSEAEMSYGDYGSDFDVNEYGDYGSDFDVNEYGEYGSDYGSDYGSQDDAGTVDEWESLEYVSEDEYANTFAQVQTSESSESGDESSECSNSDSCTTDGPHALAQEEGSEWELNTEELEELVDEVCGDAESTDEYLECACEVAGFGCTDDEGSDGDDFDLSPEEAMFVSLVCGLP